MVDALMQNVHAVHICNWDEYVSSLHAIIAMLSWISAPGKNSKVPGQNVLTNPNLAGHIYTLHGHK